MPTRAQEAGLEFGLQKVKRIYHLHSGNVQTPPPKGLMGPGIVVTHWLCKESQTIYEGPGDGMRGGIL